MTTSGLVTPGSDPEVTIGIPVYNGEALLRTAVDSVLCQDFADLEILIADNASTDKTPEIAREYARLDPRVRYVRHETNIGGWNNFFYLLDHARGRFFSWLAHDDAYERPDHIRKLAEKLREGYVLAFPNVAETHYDSDGRIEWERHDVLGAYRGADTRFRMSRVAVRCSAHPLYGMFRIDALRSYTPVLTEDRVMIHYGEGRFVQKLIANERCAFVPEAIQTFGVHGKNAGMASDVRRVFRDFVLYVWRSPGMYRGSPLSTGQRILLYGEILRVRVPTVVVMAGLICKRTVMHAVRKLLRSKGLRTP